MRQPTLGDIRTLLDLASLLADQRAADEQFASDPFTALAQQIDYALARADEMLAEGRR